jgi:hypothetical protein
MSRSNSEVETVVVRELECPLTEAELLERGDAMAACETAVDELKAERRRLNAQIREQSDRRADLAKIIEAKTETRDVSCEWRPDYDSKRYELFRLDQGDSAPIEHREMPEADLQMRLIQPTAINKPKSPARKAARN